MERLKAFLFPRRYLAMVNEGDTEVRKQVELAPMQAATMYKLSPAKMVTQMTIQELL